MTGVNRKVRARQTRERIAAAAAGLFAARGYQGTPMTAIAAKAGVAVQTVYFAFRTKPELLIAAYDQAVLGTLDAPTPDRQDWHRRALDEAGHNATRALRQFVDGVMDILGRSAPLVAVMVTSPDDDVRRAYQDRQQGRYEAYQQLVQALERHGRIHPDLDEHKATDLLFAVLSPELHGLLCTTRGWAPEDFREWAFTTLQAQLLHHQASQQRRRGPPPAGRAPST
jgi:AcrR family transcriptional regulator